MNKLITKIKKIKLYWFLFKRIIKWIPLLIKDRDYDYVYTLDILKFKLQLKKERFKSYDDLNVVNQINLVIKLIDKFKNEEYLDEYLNYGEYKYEFLDNDIKTTLISENYDEYINKNKSSLKRMNRIFSKNIDLLDSESFSVEEKKSISMDISLYKHDKCKRILFNYLAHKIENWWN